MVLYGDEVGMIGSGGDKAAREDMFPTQVSEWQTESRVGSPPIGKGSSFDVTGNPIATQVATLAALRDQYPALSTGASVVRYASGPVLVVSRIDPATGVELVTAFNNGDAAAKVTVTTATPGHDVERAVRQRDGRPPPACEADPERSPPCRRSWRSRERPIPAAAPAAPVLKAGPDPISSYYALTATVAGAPVTVAFATRVPGRPWARVAVDDSAPYRAFLDPLRFKKGQRIQVVAIARGFNGATSVSRVLTVSPHG